MHDIFFLGKKPNLFPHEQPVIDIFDAASKSRTAYCWVVDSTNDYTDFNFKWIPPKWESHHMHIFGSQWQKNGNTYFVPKGITKENLVKNYRAENRVVRKPGIENWIVPKNIDTNSFDFSWHPDPDEPVYVHIFGTQWWDVGGPVYKGIEAVDPKFHNEFRAKTIPIMCNWLIPDNLDKSSFDFSWCPHPDEPPYIYQFGTQWQRSGGPQYREWMNNGKIKYVDNIKADAIPKMFNWYLDDSVDYSNFDFSWHPDNSQLNYRHIFGSQWQQTSSTSFYAGTDMNPPINYIEDIRVTSSSNALPKYYIETTLQDLIDTHPSERFWALSKDLEYDEFDFSWHPDLSQVDYQHVFGSQWQQHSETYLINSSTWDKKQINYVSDVKTTSSANLDIFFVDKGNKESSSRFKVLKEKYPQLQKTRFANNLQQTAKRCSNKAKTDRFWMISSEFVYENFDFSWSPEPWEMAMTHIFGSKWNKWSDTVLLSKFDIKRINWTDDIKDWPNLNFVSVQKAETDEKQSEIWYIDHYNPESEKQLAVLKDKYPNIKVNRFVDNYLDAITRCINQAEASHIWIVSSICDYSEFDFGWYPDAWQNNMLHAFASNEQKYGDTFFVPVDEFKKQRANISKLEDFNSVNYLSIYEVKRHDVETVIYSEETLTKALKSRDFSSNYALFLPENYVGDIVQYTPNLWSGKDRHIHVLSEGAEFSLIPKDVVRYFNDQLYDYPFINFDKKETYTSQPLDIIFISNGESMAEQMWDKLNEVVIKGGFKNRVKRIDGVNGRAAAYKAASSISETSWAFNVFAKLEVVDTFDFSWQPDRMQEPKHYIFHARNPLNGLEYGHQAIIAYQKDIVLGMDDTHGLDFTLAAPHEVVPMLSGISHYNEDPLITWRTSFRECVKLKYFADTNNDDLARKRLDIWSTIAEGENAEWSLKGAKDAIEYYDSVNGELNKLMLSFEWEWLNNKFKSCHSA